MGYTSESYTPAGTRKDGLAEVPTRKTWVDTFHTDWQFLSVVDPVSSWTMSWCGDTETRTKRSSADINTLNSAYSENGNVQIFGLWGRANAGLSSPDETSNLKNAKWVFNKLNFIPRKEHLKTSEIQFYPYYKMKFVSGINGAEQDAYLTSENLSKLLNVQRVDTSISANGNTATGNSLYLDSTQSL